jgi:hypothetical protein
MTRPMTGRTRGVLSAVIVLTLAGAAVGAGNVDRAIADAESRRKGAESSMREIVAKADPPDQVRAAYTAAASHQNAWLDLVCQAVEEGAPAAPDVTAASEAATAALMDWITIGGRALGLEPLSDSLTEGLRKSIARDLVEIASDTWSTHRSADAKKRTKATTSLQTRLRWKTAEELPQPLK